MATSMDSTSPSINAKKSSLRGVVKYSIQEIALLAVAMAALVATLVGGLSDLKTCTGAYGSMCDSGCSYLNRGQQISCRSLSCLANDKLVALEGMSACAARQPAAAASN